MMRVEGSRRVAIGAGALWGALSDPRRLGDALPGVEHVDVDGQDRFSVLLRPATGLGVTPLTMDFHVAERDEPRRVRITGSGRGGEHALSVDVELLIGADGDGAQVRWVSDVRVLGVLASVGQRVLPGLVREQMALLLSAAERDAGAPG